MNVQKFLVDKKVPFDVIPHRTACDASRLAQTLHVTGKCVAKTVLLRGDHGFRFFVAVLPANRRIDLHELGHCLSNCHLELATEEEVVHHCPDCEAGVLPPFGSQYGIRTVVDESLLAEPEILFEGNSHQEAIRMRMADFRELEQPLVCPFGKPAV